MDVFTKKPVQYKRTILNQKGPNKKKSVKSPKKKIYYTKRNE